MSYRIELRLRNGPGALAGALAKVAEKGLDLVSVAGNIRPDAGRAVVVLTAVPRKGPVPPAELEKLVDSSPLVLGSRAKTIEGGMFVEETFPVTMGTGDRVMIMRSEQFAGMLSTVREAYGSGGDAIVYGQGLAAGRGDAEALVRILGKDTAVAHMGELTSLYTALGWGRTTVQEPELGPLKARLRVEENMECEGKRTRKPYSEFLKGHITGVAEVLLGIKARCAEEKCIARGDPCCEFVITAE